MANLDKVLTRDSADTRKLRIMPEEEIVTKTENQAFQKEILKILVEQKKEWKAGLDNLSQAFQQLIRDLRSQVDGLFVSDRVKKIEDGHNQKMKGVDEKLASIDEKLMSVDKRMAKVKDGKTPKKGIDYFDGISATPSMEMVNEALKKPMEEFQKKWEDLVQNLISSRKMAGATPHNLVQIFNASSQVDGFRKTFTNLPHARNYTMVFLRGENPSNLAVDVDFTVGRGSITLLDHIPAPQSGTNLYIQYSK